MRTCVSVDAHLQGAAQGTDSVQPVVHQRVSGSLGEAAPELLPAAGPGVSEGRDVGLLQGPVQLLQSVQRLRLTALRGPPVPPLRDPPLSAVHPQLPHVWKNDQGTRGGCIFSIRLIIIKGSGTFWL